MERIETLPEVLETEVAAAQDPLDALFGGKTETRMGTPAQEALRSITINDLIVFGAKCVAAGLCLAVLAGIAVGVVALVVANVAH